MKAIREKLHGKVYGLRYQRCTMSMGARGPGWRTWRYFGKILNLVVSCMFPWKMKKGTGTSGTISCILRIQFHLYEPIKRQAQRKISIQSTVSSGNYKPKRDFHAHVREQGIRRITDVIEILRIIMTLNTEKEVIPLEGLNFKCSMRLWWTNLSLKETSIWELRRNLYQPMTFCPKNDKIKSEHLIVHIVYITHQFRYNK